MYNVYNVCSVVKALINDIRITILTTLHTICGSEPTNASKLASYHRVFREPRAGNETHQTVMPSPSEAPSNHLSLVLYGLCRY